MVVDDHPAFRVGLIALIESQSDMAVVAECGNGCEAVEQFRRVRPDVTLMDLRLPGQSGVEAILTIRKEFPEGRIIVITTFDCDEDIYRACESGAKAYLFKDASKDEIINAIRTVHAGQRWLPTKVASRLDECLKRPKLSERGDGCASGPGERPKQQGNRHQSFSVRRHGQNPFEDPVCQTTGTGPHRRCDHCHPAWHCSFGIANPGVIQSAFPELLSLLIFNHLDDACGHRLIRPVPVPRMSETISSPVA